LKWGARSWAPRDREAGHCHRRSTARWKYEIQCIYCFARPTHEYFGLSAGLDFETKIYVKEDAPELLRQALASPRWEPEVIAMSGVTDCYQPVERKLELTRRCLEVLAEFRTPAEAELLERDDRRDGKPLGLAAVPSAHG
jgi:hypothetical protein